MTRTLVLVAVALAPLAASGGGAGLPDLTGPIATTADGTWQISRVDFCAFMAQARTPCS